MGRQLAVTSTNRSNTTSTTDWLLDIFLRIIVAIWLVAGFILPNTFPGQVSASGFLSLIPTHSVSLPVICLTVTVSVAVWFLLRPLKPSRPTAFLWVLTLIYLALIAASAFAQSKEYHADNNAFLLLATFTVGLMFARICGEPRLIAYLLCISGGIQACCTISDRVAMQSTWGSAEVLRAGGTFGNPTGIYTVMLFCLPLAVSLAVAGREKIEKAVWVIVAVLLFAALVLTWYRGGLLAGAVGLVWLFSRTAGRKWPVLLLGAVLALALVAAVYVRSAGALHTLASDGTLQSRYVLWHEGWQSFRTHWFTGVGMTHLRLPMHSNDDGIPADQVYPDPHNLPLFWLDELGVGGGFLFLSFVACIGGVIRRSDTPLALGVGATWLAFLVAGMFDTPFGLGTRERVFANALSGALLGATLLLSRSGPQKEKADAASVPCVHVG